MFSHVSMEEQKVILGKSKKERIPCPDGWTLEFFVAFIEILGNDLLQVIEYSRVTYRILSSFNLTFIILILKVDNLRSLGDFIPISLCNSLCKIV